MTNEYVKGTENFKPELFMQLVQTTRGLEYDIHIFEQIRDRFYLAKPVELVFEEQEGAYVSSKSEPTIRLPKTAFESIQQSIIREFEMHGWKESMNHMRGMHKAQKDHLEDMRDMNKKMLDAIVMRISG